MKRSFREAVADPTENLASEGRTDGAGADLRKAALGRCGPLSIDLRIRGIESLEEGVDDERTLLNGELGSFPDDFVPAREFTLLLRLAQFNAMIYGGVVPEAKHLDPGRICEA